MPVKWPYGFLFCCTTKPVVSVTSVTAGVMNYCNTRQVFKTVETFKYIEYDNQLCNRGCHGDGNSNYFEFCIVFLVRFVTQCARFEFPSPLILLLLFGTNSRGVTGVTVKLNSKRSLSLAFSLRPLLTTLNAPLFRYNKHSVIISSFVVVTSAPKSLLRKATAGNPAGFLFLKTSRVVIIVEERDSISTTTTQTTVTVAYCNTVELSTGAIQYKQRGKETVGNSYMSKFEERLICFYVDKSNKVKNNSLFCSYTATFYII